MTSEGQWKPSIAAVRAGLRCRTIDYLDTNDIYVRNLKGQLMSDHAPEADAVLRQALDSIDRIRQRMMWAGYLAVAATIGAFGWLDHVARQGTTIRSVVFAAVLAVVCVIAWSVFALAILMTRMTKRILRAIDLSSRKT